MKNQIRKDKTKRKFVFESENKCIILKSIAKNKNLSDPSRCSANLRLTDLNSKTRKSKLVDRCVLTGRKSKIGKSYKFSRLSFLKLARNGWISGLKKSAW